VDRGSPGSEAVDGLSSLEDAALSASLSSTVAAVRDVLGVDLALVTRIDSDSQHYEIMDGDAAGFGFVPGTAAPLDETYCAHVLAGRLPNLIPDTSQQEITAAMPVTQAAGIGAYASMPITFSDGSLYGTLCAVNHETKPELGPREEQFLHVLARLVSDQLEREQLQEQALEAEREATASMALTRAVEARDAYTAEHSKIVVGFAVAVGEQLGLGEAELSDLAQVALLHDIGKIAIPDSILRKEGPLDDGEWELMRQHPIHGDELIRRTPGLAHLAPAVRAEHERWDGGGYPDGLAGEAIPLASRIVFACDAYHAMVSDRPYRKHLDDAEARRRLEEGSGSQFCPTVVGAMLAALDAGTLSGSAAD
jgi:response regulator RpfG family c-di-GMP phosphodiesterase